MNNECFLDDHTVNEFYARIDSLIQKYGFTMINTEVEIPARGNIGPGLVDMTYTVGLADRGVPEMIMFGIGPTLARSTMNQLGELARTGKLSSDGIVADIFREPVHLKQITNNHVAEYLKVAVKRNGPHIAAKQVVFYDAAGKYPWEPGYDAARMAAQPILYLML